MTPTFDAIVALVLVLSITCGLLGCAEVIRKGWRYVRHWFKSFRWMQTNRRYMARWTRG